MSSYISRLFHSRTCPSLSTFKGFLVKFTIFWGGGRCLDFRAARSSSKAAVVGSKMFVVGGETVRGMLLEDVQVLNFDKLTWSAASPKFYLPPSTISLKIPACEGEGVASMHRMIAWSEKTRVEAFRCGYHVLDIQGHHECTQDLVRHLIDRLLRRNLIQMHIRLSS